MQLYVSTSGHKGDAISQAARLSKKGFKSIELSGGTHSSNLIDDLELLKQIVDNLLLHNYFPPPAVPFVMNLASSNQEISELSIELAMRAIEFSSKIGSSYYGVHAGFLFDPKIEDLGNVISRTEIMDREVGMERFTTSIEYLADFAKKRNVKLLVENNVLSQANLESFEVNPFLLVDPDEILQFFENIDSNVGLLLDLGHLNVSARSLQIQNIECLEKVSKFVCGYHFSDNNGREDQHLELQPTTWFLPHIDKNAEFGTLEIHSQDFKQIENSLTILEEIEG